MTPNKKLKSAFGIMFAVISILVGFVSVWMLAGLGICGFDLTRERVYFALGSSVIMPALTVRFLPLPWWISPLFFCFGFPVIIIEEILGQEWLRAFAALGCVATALVSAWLFRPRSRNA